MVDTSYVVVTGGVLSGLGKGTIISSLGALLKARGVDVTAVKIDPYLNVDAGTMSPGEHGEVFVCVRLDVVLTHRRQCFT